MKPFLGLLAIFGVVWVNGNVFAQPTYPDKPVRIVVSFPPGAPADVMARVIGQKLSEMWGQPVIIENLPGASGNVGAARVAKAPPDGYTLVASGDAAMTTNVTLYGRQLPYDPLKDFAPVMLVVLSTNVLVVHPSVPARNVKELVSLAKLHPGKLSYASTGNGTSQHLGGELLKKMAGIDIVHVPYKGATPVIQDLVSGRIEMNFGNIITMMTPVREGRLRRLAVSSLKRWALLPDVPTVAESGLPGFEAVAWFGLLAPAGTADITVQKLYQDLGKVLATPDTRAKLTDLGFEVVGRSPRDFGAQIKSEIATKGQLVRDSGAKLD